MFPSFQRPRAVSLDRQHSDDFEFCFLLLSFSLPWADEKTWGDISQAVSEHFLGEIEISLKVRIVTHFHWSTYLRRRKHSEKLIQEAVLWWEDHMARSQGNLDSKANLLRISCEFLL